MTLLLIFGVLLIFAALFLVFSAIGGLTAERSGVNRSLELLREMTNAPRQAVETHEDRPFVERVLDPLYDRFQDLGRRLNGAGTPERVRHALDLAGNPAGWSVDRVAAAKAIGAFFGISVALLVVVAVGVGFPLLILVLAAGLTLGFFGPNLYLYQKAYDRKERIQKELADAIDLLTISVEAGLAFDAGLQQVARNTTGPIGEELARVLQEMQLGQSRAEAMRNLGERTNLPELRSFVSAMVQADSFGIPIGHVLRVQSQELRLKRRQWAEQRAQQVPVKITVPLIFCILPCLFVVIMGPAVLSMMDGL